MYLAQKLPGDWYIFSDHIPNPIPVPSWLIEQTPMEDREFLVKELSRIYGSGRRVGQTEGRNAIRNSFKELMFNDPES